MSKKSQKPLALQSPKGMHDILPQDEYWWEKIRKAVHDVTVSYNFLRIDTTLLEAEDLFERSLGSTSDVVEKQMFVFKTKGGDSLVLRPECTAPVVRAYIEHGLSQMARPLKLYYMGPMFRYEQPQAGRFRQFYQAGFEIIGGDEDAIYDAQIILTCYRVLEALKFKKLIIKLNSIGCKNCRPLYRKKLVDYFKSRMSDAQGKSLCKDCERRLAINPLRLLDCKNSECIELAKDAPITLNSLCSYCKAHFKGVLEYLDELQLPYMLDNHLVRGLDYYNRTVFEIFLDRGEERGTTVETKKEGQETLGRDELPDVALAGGGRYDYLVALLGGRETPAVGGALGLDRLVAIMKSASTVPLPHATVKLFLIHIGDLAKKKSLVLIEQLRREGLDISESLGKESLKAQLRVADKSGALYALIFGQKEALEASIIIRDLQTGAQETVPLTHVTHELKRRLK